MAVETTELATVKRRLILRDTFALLTLLAITVVLFGLTLLLFHSFQQHREELAVRWAARGRAAYDSNHPEQAIVALRTALTYAPDRRSYELLLAESLGRAGHTEESFNYFLSLWDTQPGDGFINLQLARLSATRHDVQGAIHYYRASIYGNWQGDGVQRRREVRLELSRYLIAQHDPGQARTELLIAAGNAPNLLPLDLTLANLLEQTGDSTDALRLHRQALQIDPNNLTALENAGRIAFDQNNFTLARTLFERAQHQQANPQTDALLAQIDRLQQLNPLDTLPPGERVRRILAARTIARKRLDDCIATAFSTAESLQPLADRWTAEEKVSRAALLSASDKQAASIQLIDDTEFATSQQCGPPTGDDALLLRLAQTRAATREGVSHP